MNSKVLGRVYLRRRWVDILSVALLASWMLIPAEVWESHLQSFPVVHHYYHGVAVVLIHSQLAHVHPVDCRRQTLFLVCVSDWR
jgi:nitric oxide reductase large subunit